VKTQVKRLALVVEGTTGFARIFLDVLARDNIVCKVVLTRNRVEALDYLLGRGAYSGRDDAHVIPCVTLIDLSLPDSDGLHLLQEMRAHKKTRVLPIVAFSSADDQPKAAAVYASEANSYMDIRPGFKPFEESLRQVAHYWCVLNEPPPSQ
jgi:two-component system, response regulator